MNIEINTIYDSRPEAVYPKCLVIKVGKDSIILPWEAAKQLPHEIEKHLVNDGCEELKSIKNHDLLTSFTNDLVECGIIEEDDITLPDYVTNFLKDQN